MMISFILILGTFAETFALQWTSSSTFPNGTLINVCLGDNVTFPWKYSVNSSERIIDVEWYYVNQDLETLLAAYIGDRFLAYGDLDRHLQFVPNAGLQLTGVTLSDMGQYTVHVNLNGQELSQTAFLHEPEAPITLSGTLQAYILPATQFPVINGESHLQLGCGDFQSLGEPPISVMWRTPSAQNLSSTYNNGVFGLTLPNPIEGGNYTCEINGTSNAHRCLQDNSLLQTVSTVYVDEITSTLLLFRSDMEWLRQENARITEENARIMEENARLQAYINQFELVDASMRPFSCLNIKDYDAVSKIHTIYPNGFNPVKVYCDQVTDNGGWTVIQRRQDGSVNFYRNWTEYESGFGNPESEYWIGLANLHVMTSGKTAILRVDLMGFDGTTAYATYNTFNVSGPEDNYRLTIGGYSGTAETFALQWISSSTFPNGTRVNVCLGDNVTFPWKYNVTSSESVIDVEWYYVNQNHETLLAAYIGDQFLAYGDLERRLQFVPNAGLQLTGVTSSDMGTYSVHVNLDGQRLSQAALLHEPEPPVTLSGTLQTHILPATQIPVINGESHLQLGCGDFQSLGEPPITVTWRTPSGQIRSSTYNNGVFGLTLPNPLEGGNYTCQIHGAPISQRCLQHNSLLHAVSTVYVDEITSTLLLFRNDIQWLREENERITEENARVTEENARIMDENARLQAYNNQFELVDASIRPFSCLNVKEYDEDSRIHTIYPNGSHPVKVYCDQVIDNGGWTVIQRRQDGSVDFYRNWTEYESGFGNPESEYWIGLANLHVMTSGKTAILRVDLMGFNGTTVYATYNTFNVSGPEDNYRLTIGGYNGTAGDSLQIDNNMQFSTYDRDHDVYASDCAELYHGAWWYGSCSVSNLNGRYYSSGVDSTDSIWWVYWHNYQSLKRVEMKIRV